MITDKAAMRSTLFGPLEDLHEDLVPHLREGVLGPMVHHPLVVEILARPELYSHLNRQYLKKREVLAEALQEQNWGSYIFLHERPYRFDALLKIADAVASEQDFWDLVSTVWTDSENIWENHKAWVRLWTSRANPHLAMEAKERDKLARLPETVTIWRGFNHPKGRLGLSWTLSESKARWFANRFSKGRTPTVIRGEVGKTDILAYFANRGEQEIVVVPKTVRQIKVVA